jgi:putative heme-binding domain-containing protein
MTFALRFSLTLVAIAVFSQSQLANAQSKKLELKSGDKIAIIGNTTADRLQHHGWLETYIQALHPKHALTFRNLGFPGDEIALRQRSQNFGSPDQWLSKVQADVVFCFFGYNEALKGLDAIDGFRKNLAKIIDEMRARKYNGQSAPRLVVFSPIAHENLNSRHLPDGSQNNAKLSAYTAVMKDVCKTKGVTFVDVFAPMAQIYGQADKPLTMNGIHLLDLGNKQLASVIVNRLFPGQSVGNRPQEIERLRRAVLDKNLHWFSRYRVVDGYNVFGGRSKLAWFGQSNADVMMREMEIFDIMTGNRDKKIQAIANGGDLQVKDDNLPKELVVKTNKPGPLKDEAFPYLSGKAAIDRMTIAEGMQVNLFASEEMFPELVNPVQMAVDTDGRLFASVWPSYPHWNPIEPRRDRILCFPDDDGDGVADKCIIFADKLNSVTGFEFWGGGVLVAAPPEIWFLKDSDGDDKADIKIRVLQGVSSADTHHSANAVVIGPDGGMNWSRGVFNVASMETPTQTYRSGSSGVHRFDPRTFEMSFVFPIGPNPHGDVIDQWGFQFANDGTGGTGSYVNIGKGVSNKKWFEKRVRPVAATGILSSSHFPEANRGNFLICNTIGFLGVLQHEVRYNGADITAVEIEPILFSSDQNFRPTDVEVGGDGALYVSDWSNILIGHMQHNMRDPNRDHAHGRIYRVSAKGRAPLKPVKLKGKPILEVCRAFYAKENGTRYRARLELSGRDTDEVVRTVGAYADRLNPLASDKTLDHAQALLECLWVFEEHRIPNPQLLAKVFTAQEARVRAAAIRTLGHWGDQVPEWKLLLLSAARDDSALVRAEAVKAAVSFEGIDAAEAIFEVANRKRDPEIDTVLKYATGQIDVNAMVQAAIQSGQQLSPAARQYALASASVEDLLKLDQAEDIYNAILSRSSVPLDALRDSLHGLAKMKNVGKSGLLLTMIEERDKTGDTASLNSLSQLISEQPSDDLRKVRDRFETLAIKAKSNEARRLGYTALITADGSGDTAFVAAAKSKNSLRDLLEAIPSIGDDELRSSLYDNVRMFMFELPSTLQAEGSSPGFQKNGIKVDYFYPSGKNVAIETLAKLQPKASGVVPEITMNVPQRKQADKFALRFTGMIQIPKSGRWSFYTASDDGSRLYIGDKLVVNNDGLHGMSEKRGRLKLKAGPHAITVTYFDNGGGDGLIVQWEGPGVKKQKIKPAALTISGGDTIHDVAIRAAQSIPGHDQKKIADLTQLVKTGRNRSSAIRALRGLPVSSWPKSELRPMSDNLIGYLTEIPAEFRNGQVGMDAVALVTEISKRLKPNLAKAVIERLKNLDVRIIAIGTVPERMIYDKEIIAVQAGKPVEFRFSNSDNMPHNFAIVQPGSLQEIGELAEATARDADAMDRDYIPVSDKILVASRLLQPGQDQAISFMAPEKTGVYPYVCTYPGHWRRMYGALYVVEDLEAYNADPAAYLTANPMPLQDELLTYMSRNTDWKFKDLIASVSPLPHGRSFDVGKKLFSVGNCVACHKMNGIGQELGPDLTKLDPKKKTTEHILRSLIEPSKDIDEKYQSYSFVMDTGKIVTGMIVKEDANSVNVLIDPLAKAAPLVLKKENIDDRDKSKASIMPRGLLNKLTAEEILDLIAYVYTAGDKAHMLFKGHDHNH